jgi:hypothetical protein
MTTLGPITTNTKTGAKGSASDFVANFERLWAHPTRHLESFLDSLSPNVRLIAPLGVVTVGREAGLQSLRRTFAALPDMRGEVDRWAETNDAILIEMRFIATIGRHRVEWPNVDRFRFENGVAIERVAYFDPTPLKKAFTRNLEALLQLYRLRLRGPRV